ncbi:MAG: flippase-like domain-containing protein [Candidatus Latescibacterota bacterium]|nr:MAG: flippase-like domain-containing protein [Candidatus Latescibacterota bacterium]
MRPWFRYLVYASLVFLAVALYKADYLVIPRVHSPTALICSLVFLLFGFIGDGLSWRKILDKSGHPISVSETIAATGLSSFAKYIPGKIWAVMGRAGYIAEKRPYSLGGLTSVSVTWQLLMLWLGLIFGAFGLILLDQILVWGWPILLLWLGLTTLIFSDVAQSLAQRLYKKIFSKDITIPRLSAGSTLTALPWFVITWISFSIGFYLLAAGLSPDVVPRSVGLGFPLSIALGVMAVLIPGGLGVREGFMVGYLKLAGFSLQDATTISVAARLWFLAGEIFIFVLGMMASARVDKTRSV